MKRLDPFEKEALLAMFERVVTPTNVALGHTWLKRKLRVALDLDDDKMREIAQEALNRLEVIGDFHSHQAMSDFVYQEAYTMGLDALIEIGVPQ